VPSPQYIVALRIIVVSTVTVFFVTGAMLILPQEQLLPVICGGDRGFDFGPAVASCIDIESEDYTILDLANGITDESSILEIPAPHSVSKQPCSLYCACACT